MRGLLVLAGVILAFVLLSPILRGWRPRLPGSGDHPDQLVKDPFCGTYVLRSRAVRRESGGEALHFCSADCAAKSIPTHSRHKAESARRSSRPTLMPCVPLAEVIAVGDHENDLRDDPRLGARGAAGRTGRALFTELLPEYFE